MRWLLSAYTIRLNHRPKLFGHVFSGRYKALIVDGSGTGYLKTVCDYVHLNPVRAWLRKPENRLLSYPWSSLVWYVTMAEHRPSWMRVDRLLGEHGIEQDTAAGRQEFERRMEIRRLERSRGQTIVLFGTVHFSLEMPLTPRRELPTRHPGVLHTHWCIFAFALL